MASWQYQIVDNSQLTTISELTPHTIYTIRVQALTSVGPGPLSLPVQIKTQQGVPSQPEMLTAVDIGETKVTLQWSKPAHSAENILSYELYWNDTYAKVPNDTTINFCFRFFVLNYLVLFYPHYVVNKSWVLILILIVILNNE